MKSSWMALAAGAALAGCSTGGDGNVFASRDTTVEYYRVFDIKTEPGNKAVITAASEGLNKRVSDVTLATPALSGALQEQPGHFKLADPSSTPPGGAAGNVPSCEGATWTAKGTPRVNGGDNMNIVACLFPYKNGYHLDMYAVFTKKEGGWLEWPRKMTGRFIGTPEKWTDQTMVEVVRAIRDNTGARVAVVEAKPALMGTPWLEPASAAPAATAPAAAPAPAAVPAPATPPAAPSAGSASSAGATTNPVPPAGTTAGPAPDVAGQASAAAPESAAPPTK
jgi:hypothetical protein